MYLLIMFSLNEVFSNVKLTVSFVRFVDRMNTGKTQSELNNTWNSSV